MIEVDVSKYNYDDLKFMDEWIGENIFDLRPKDPEPYHFENTGALLRLYFTYEEDELAFRLRFPIR